MFKTCYIFVIARLCYGFIILGILLLLFLLCIRTVLVLCIVFFRLVLYLAFAWYVFWIYETNMFVYMYVCMNIRAYVCFNTSFLGAEFGSTNHNWHTTNYGYVWREPAIYPCVKMTIARRLAYERHPLTACRSWWPSGNCGDRCVRPVSGKKDL
jgi:hypothetical protein